MNRKLPNTRTNEFNYSNYLRDYYFRLASGQEKVPSNAELELFLRKLAKTTPLKTLEHKILDSSDVSEDDQELKMIA